MKHITINQAYLADDKGLSHLFKLELDELIDKLNACEYNDSSTQYGYFCYCPTCNKYRMTTRCACMCGSCLTCDFRWVCRPYTDFLESTNVPNIRDFRYSN